MCVLSREARVGSDSPSIASAQTPILTLFATNTVSINKKKRTLKKKSPGQNEYPLCLFCSLDGCEFLMPVDADYSLMLFFWSSCFSIRSFEQLPHL